ncbi:MAG: hypothetical protein ABSG86_29185 [Thermoguttaceae bacterium]|jgi:hypothetical protein
MSLNHDAPQPSGRPRRRRQYAIVALFGIALVSVSLCGWIALEIQRARVQRDAVAALRALRFDVCYDYQVGDDDFPTPVGKWQGVGRIGDWLGEDFFCSVVAVRAPSLGISNCGERIRFSAHVNDDNLAPLEKLRGLRRVTLDGAQVTDDGIGHLDALDKLERLSLCDTNITDRGIHRLIGRANLLSLDVMGTKITDAAFADICQFPMLEVLSVGNDSVTDQGLLQLASAKNLKKLTVSMKPVMGTATGARARGLVTGEGIDALQQRLPGCKISWVLDLR